MSPIDDAVAEAVINGIVEGRIKGCPFEGLPQKGLEKEGVERVVQVGHEGVGGLLAHGFYHRAVSTHRLNSINDLCERNDDAVIELSLPKVDGLSKPDKLEHQRAEDGQQAGQDEKSDSASGHTAKLRVHLGPFRLLWSALLWVDVVVSMRDDSSLHVSQ